MRRSGGEDKQIRYKFFLIGWGGRRKIYVGCEDLDVTDVRHVQETTSDRFADEEVALNEVQRMAVEKIGMEVTLNNGKPRQDGEPRTKCGTRL